MYGLAAGFTDSGFYRFFFFYSGSDSGPGHQLPRRASAPFFGVSEGGSLRTSDIRPLFAHCLTLAKLESGLDIYRRGSECVFQSVLTGKHRDVSGVARNFHIFEQRFDTRETGPDGWIRRDVNIITYSRTMSRSIHALSSVSDVQAFSW